MSPRMSNLGSGLSRSKFDDSMLVSQYRLFGSDTKGSSSSYTVMSTGMEVVDDIAIILRLFTPMIIVLSLVSSLYTSSSISSPAIGWFVAGAEFSCCEFSNPPFENLVYPQQYRVFHLGLE